MDYLKSFTADARLINEGLRSKWGWFLALGSVLVLLGIAAFSNLAMATRVTIFYVGALMTVAGVFQIAHSFQVKKWTGFFFFFFSGLFYAAAGIIAFTNPLLAAATLTLIFAFALIISGAIRIWSSLQLSMKNGWGWVLASGLITLVAGIVFITDWPINTLWLLGMLLAVDLTFQGITTIALGFTLKSSISSSASIHRAASAH